MNFAYPQGRIYLVLAFAAAVLAVLALARKRWALRRLARQGISQPGVLVRPIRQILKCALLLLVALLLGIAVLGPQWGWIEEEIPTRRGRDVVIVLDVSRSMLAEDVAPNRLERARADLRDLADYLERAGGYRIGLLTFAERAAVLCPLTSDYRCFAEELADVSLKSLRLRGHASWGDGTQIGTALDRAGQIIDDDNAAYTDILLISDGDDMARETLAAADALAHRGITVHTLGLGDADRGSLIPVRDLLGRPAFTVHSGGQTMRTRPIDLTVIEARPSPWVKAALSLSKPEPFAGDTVNLYVDLLVRRPTQQLGRGNLDLKSQPINHVTLTIPALEGYQEIRPLELLEKYVEKRRLPPGQLGYHINNYPGVILLEQEPVGSASHRSFHGLDPQWYRRRLTIPFRVLQAGEMALPPLRVGGEVYVPAGGRNRYTWEGFVASSAPLNFRILDAVNRPADPLRQAPAQATADTPPIAEEPSSLAEESPPLVEHSFPEATKWEAALTVVFLILGVVVGLRRRPAARSQHAVRLRQRRQNIMQARQRLHAPSLTADEVSAAVQDFLRVRLDMTSGEITPEEAAECLTQAGYPAELAESCAEVLRACAVRQFAPGQAPSGAEDLAIVADRILGAILASQPKKATAASASVDELTRARLAALAD